MRKDEFARYLREARGHGRHDRPIAPLELRASGRIRRRSRRPLRLRDRMDDSDRPAHLLHRGTNGRATGRRGTRFPSTANLSNRRSATLKHAARLYRDFRAEAGDPDRRAEIDRLTYSTEQERRNRPTRHKVPIDGDLRTGFATPKQAAARRYRDFRAEAGDSAGGKPERAAAWPDWSSPSEDRHAAASPARSRAMCGSFVRTIVEAVTKDNARHAERMEGAAGRARHRPGHLSLGQIAHARFRESGATPEATNRARFQ